VTTDSQSGDLDLAGKLADGSMAGRWTLDPARSSVALRSKSMWGLMPVKGTFGEISGAAEITAAGQASGTITVRTASIDTKVDSRDKHLRSADFFDSENYPEITFTAAEVTLDGAGASVTGSLEVRGQTRPLTFPASLSLPDADTLELGAQVRIDRSDYGLTWKGPLGASMHNTMTIRVVFTRG
jgi:polyisoprenoid-binding protein YceI